MNVLILIIGLFLIIFLIISHEFGHYLVAKRNGVIAEEFAIFFGPTLYSRKTKSGTLFRFNCIPLGGYVKLKGEHDTDTGPGTYGGASLWVKSKILLAGVATNFVTSIVMLIIVCLVGLPVLLPNQFTVASNAHIINKTAVVASVIKNSPAAKAGLKSGDDIVAIGPVGNIQVITPNQTLQDLTRKYAGKSVDVQYTRNSKLKTVLVKLNPPAPHQTIYLGVVFNSLNAFSFVRYTWAAPIVTIGYTKQLIVLSYQAVVKTFQGIGGIFAGLASHNHAARERAQTTATSQVGSPYLIWKLLTGISSQGFEFMFYFVAYIAFAIALFNVLPIPGLDGGTLWLTLIFHLARRKLKAHTQEMITAISMGCLLLLVGILTYAQVLRYH